MQEAFISIVNQFGYFGVAFLIFIENVFPPIPSEAILLFGGFMTTKTNLEIIYMIIAATIGSLLGASALYGIGYALGPERLKKLLKGRAGKILHLKAESVDKAQNWFSKYGPKAVLICRCVPIVRSIISVPAGITKMHFLPFILLTALGSAVWNTLLIYAGAAAGAAWESCLEYFDVYTIVAIIVIVLVIVVGVIIHKRKSKDI